LKDSFAHALVNMYWRQGPEGHPQLANLLAEVGSTIDLLAGSTHLAWLKAEVLDKCFVPSKWSVYQLADPVPVVQLGTADAEAWAVNLRENQDERTTQEAQLQGLRETTTEVSDAVRECRRAVRSLRLYLSPAVAAPVVHLSPFSWHPSHCCPSLPCGLSWRTRS
jgi:hypothetical protein